MTWGLVLRWLAGNKKLTGAALVVAVVGLLLARAEIAGSRADNAESEAAKATARVEVQNAAIKQQSAEGQAREARAATAAIDVIRRQDARPPPTPVTANEYTRWYHDTTFSHR